MPKSKKCSVDGCLRVTGDWHLLCPGHQKRKLAGLPLVPLPRRSKNKGLTCSVSGCVAQRHAKTFCCSHYERWRKARADGKLELGEWNARIRTRRWGRKKVSVQMWPSAIEIVQRRAEERGLSFGDALIELAAPEIARLSGSGSKRVWESIRPSGWERNDYDDTERL